MITDQDHVIHLSVTGSDQLVQLDYFDLKNLALRWIVGRLRVIGEEQLSLNVFGIQAAAAPTSSSASPTPTAPSRR